MKRQRALAITATGALATAVALALSTSPASADPLQTKADEARTDLLGNVSPDLVEQMSSTFDLTADQVYDRLAVEAVASELLAEAPETYESNYAGLWVGENADEIFVATTSEADAADIRADGATPVVVEHGLSDLEAAQAAVEAAQTDAFGHYIDVETNRVVIETADEAAAVEAIDAAGIDASIVTVDTTAEAPETFAVRGGDAYNIDNASRCSVGFAVTQGGTPGFVTAGHCGSSGSSVTGGSASPGTFEESVFPGSDAAWVSVGSDQDLQPVVNMYEGSQEVSDSNEAAVGASICRSGSTTGWHCGTVEALNQSVTYPQGTVNGLTRTDVCAEPGDSGGSFIAGSSAQGMTSGGSGDCSSGGTTYFQPVNPALSTWDLTLVTA